jgi:hypothetical protein
MDFIQREIGGLGGPPRRKEAPFGASRAGLSVSAVRSDPCPASCCCVFPPTNCVAFDSAEIIRRVSRIEHGT